MDIKSHQRVNQTLFTPVEKQLLQILVARMPAWVTPDLLTLGRSFRSDRDF